MNVLIGCEESGQVRDAFLRAGHNAMSCDLQPSREPGPHYEGDIRDVLHYPWDLFIFHAPCTHICVSGAKHFSAKRLDGRQQSGVSFFMELWRHGETHIPMMAAEQPIGVLSSLFRKPDQVIQPWMFGHGETKATCLWLRNLPALRPTQVVDGREARVHRMPPRTEPGSREKRHLLRHCRSDGIAMGKSIYFGENSMTHPTPSSESAAKDRTRTGPKPKRQARVTVLIGDNKAHTLLDACFGLFGHLLASGASRKERKPVPQMVCSSPAVIAGWNKSVAAHSDRLARIANRRRDRNMARVLRDSGQYPKFPTARVHKQQHELRDKHGAYTLVGRGFTRRIWLAGISAQRGF